MERKIIRKSERCAGCSLCVLACSATNFGVFSLEKSYISLDKDERAQKFVLAVSEGCTSCGECVRACNYGAVEYDDEDSAR